MILNDGCLITWSSSEKHFNCAFLLSQICLVIVVVSSDFPTDNSAAASADNRQREWL